MIRKISTLLFSLVAIHSSLFAEKAPNFLFIAIDDLKPVLGYQSELPGNFLQELYPDPAKRRAIAAVLSPNLDRLASSGVAFNRAFCASSVCRPSRTAIMTGFRPHVSGIVGNADGYFRKKSHPKELREAITLPQFLRSQGYYAAGTGKILHTGSDLEADFPISWDQWFNEAPAPADRGRRALSPWSTNDSKKSKMKFGADYGPIEGQEDYGNADLIARLLLEGTVSVGDRSASISPDQPFFLACGIFRPHLPLFAPKELVDLFPTEDMALNHETLESYYQDLADTPDGLPKDKLSGPLGDALKVGLEHGKEKGIKDGDLIAYRESIRHYLASVALADRCVGRLIDALEASPYADNTIVVLWSDHGWYLGEKYLFLKTRVWDEAANSVLIIRDPREGQQGQGPCSSPVNLQDLYPTISQLAGLTPPPHVAGASIQSLIQAPQADWDIPSLTTWHGNESIRIGPWAYLRYDKDPAQSELYHIPSDPDERNNLAKDPKHQAKRQELDALLNATLASKK
ncbi:sulfatase [Pelagicoccus sp. NFK12]|uniref:Sulfatase n=1 Tax=Pelagicoccus enzymogenes TaxID=2773457 RepID=A0A927IIC4_9BACT|nr:sulfatase [Pelagicoccus enzymogenes]MBD5780704.1 sulfatase [Pelagicoccus enzymogenes]